jgi:hypothetical protein
LIDDKDGPMTRGKELRCSLNKAPGFAGGYLPLFRAWWQTDGGPGRTTSWVSIWWRWRRLAKSASRRRIEPAACEVGRKANTYPVWRAGKATSQLTSSIALSWRASDCEKTAIETRRPR